MDPVAEILFNYLRDIIYNPKEASLDIEKLPDGFKDLGAGLEFFSNCVIDMRRLSKELSRGDLAAQPPGRDNEIAAPLKALQASLKHLTWQAQQIAEGDYNQRVDFMGEFSNAFNEMIVQLAERQRRLEDTISQIEKKSVSLEQSNLLLNALMQYVPLQIIVMDRDSHKILLMNDTAREEADNNTGYLDGIIKTVSDHGDLENIDIINFKYVWEEFERYFEIKTYLIEWDGSNAVILAVNDVSDTHYQMRVLEEQAHSDGLTKLYNRTFGMLTLNHWISEKKQFALVFADLDKLKYINDEFGHNDGDIYILNAAKHLKAIFSDAIICRIGGDEFMVLAENIGYENAHLKMSAVDKNLQADPFIEDKKYGYSMSFGIIIVDKENKLSAGDILAIADEEMYKNKRAKKVARNQNQANTD